MGRLHRASRLGRYDEVADYLAEGDDVNAISIRHFSALMLAAREGHLDIVKLLLKAGADVRATHLNQRTALHFSASEGHLAVAQTLVAHSAEMNARSKSGRTPAIEAALFNHGEVVIFLQAQGADITLRGNQGLTADEWLELGGVVGQSKRLFPNNFHSWDNAVGRPLALESWENDVCGLMAAGLCADEYAAKHGRCILVWSYGRFRFRDEAVEKWAHRVSEVLCTPGLLDECEERHLQGEELADARKCRARRARSRAKDR